MIFHLASEIGAVAGPAAGTFAQAGYVGVDLFFVLSGFVIADNYRHFFEPWDRDKYWRFQLVRLGRIYPVHSVMLLATVGIVAVATAAGYQRTTAGVDYSLGSFFANVLLVQAWGFPQYSWNWVAWTISAEWFAYLLFPFAAYSVFSHLTARNIRLVVDRRDVHAHARDLDVGRSGSDGTRTGAGDGRFHSRSDGLAVGARSSTVGDDESRSPHPSRSRGS